MIANKWYCIAQTNTFDTSCSVNISFDATSVLFTASVKFGKSSINIASCTIEDGYVLSVRLRETESSWAIDLLSNVKIEPNVSIADSNEWTLNNAEAGSGSIIAIISNIDSKFNSNTGTGGGGDSYWQRVNLGSESNPIYAVVPKNFNDLPVHIVSYGEVSSAGYVPGAEGGDDGGGSTVVFTPILTSGKEIAKIQIDGVEQSIYAPESYNVDLSGYATEEWVRSQGYLGNSFATSTTTTLTAHDKRIKSFEDIIGIDANGDVYIKKNGDVARNFYSYGEISSGGLSDTESGDGSVVTIEQIVTESNGVPIAVVQIDGVPTIIYAPKNVDVDLTGYATEDWVIGKNYATVGDLDSRISALINGAPAAYDTLKEIADVLAGNVDSIGDIIKALATKADKSIKVIAGTGLTGGGSLEADRTLSLATSGVTEGTYTKVTVDKYGRVTTATNIASSDVVTALGFTPYNKADFTKANIKSTLGISDWALASVKPSYNFDEIGETPTTLAGYGITDALNSSTKYAAADGVGGNANNALKFGNQLPSYYATSSSLSTTNTNLSNHITAYNSFVTATNDSLTNHSDRLNSLENMFEWDGENIKAKANFYSIGEVSSGGLSTGESTGGVTRLEGLEDVYLDNLADGQVLAYDALNDKWVNKVINASGDYLPLSGGMLSANAYVLGINRTGQYSYQPSIEFYDNGTNIGSIGVDGNKNNPFYYDINTLKSFDILHSGNTDALASSYYTVCPVPSAGTIGEIAKYPLSNIQDLSNYKSFIGSAIINGVFWNVISARHRNGYDDGYKYGFYLRTKLTDNGDLVWDKQMSYKGWQGERVIIDSSNIGQYITGGGTAAMPLNPEVIQFKNEDGSLGGWVGQGSKGNNHMFLYADDYSDLKLYTGGVQRLLIKQNGNILIGTDVDGGYKLDVTGSTRLMGVVVEYNDEINRYGGNLYIQHRGNVAGSNGLTGHTLINCNGGNVLIGTTTDIGAKLYVAGNLVATGEVTSGASASDMRLKDIVCNDYDAVSIIKNLSTFKYKWNSTAKSLTDCFSKDNYEHFGLSAQEVEKVSGYLVSNFNYGEGREYLTLKKDELVPVLVQAVKQLLTRIEILEGK